MKSDIHLLNTITAMVSFHISWWSSFISIFLLWERKNMKRLFNEHVELTHGRYWLIHPSQYFMVTPGTHLYVSAVLKYWLPIYCFDERVYKINCRDKAVKKPSQIPGSFSCEMINKWVKGNQSSRKIFNEIKVRMATTVLN